MSYFILFLISSQSMLYFYIFSRKKFALYFSIVLTILAILSILYFLFSITENF